MIGNTSPIVVEPIAKADIENAQCDFLSGSLLPQLYNGAHVDVD